ncbi:MAG: hypothetical protein K8E24_007095, partial [Methanobacterium paludis]|nr:hypothetical protein [Methanobacterium paludis]
NNDTVVDKDFLRKLVETGESHEDIGIDLVNPKTASKRAGFLPEERAVLDRLLNTVTATLSECSTTMGTITPGGATVMVVGRIIWE